MVVGSDADEISAAMTYGEILTTEDDAGNGTTIYQLPSTNLHLLFSQGPTSRGLLIFENRKLEIKENYNSYIEIGWSHPSLSENFLLSVYGRTTDALASGGYEGRGRLR